LHKRKRISETSAVLKRTLKNLPAGVAGILGSKREDWVLSAGHLFQVSRNRSFLQILLSEWANYVAKGKIKDSYETTEQHKSCLAEMLDSLDKDMPDQFRFNTMKRVFLTAATEEASTRDSVLPQQYMQLCRTLSTGEILVLLATYRIAPDPSWQNVQNYHALTWLQTIASQSGLAHSQLVELHETKLIQKGLITDRVYPDRSGVSLGAHYRLTDLGFALCQFIEHTPLEASAA